MDMPERKRWSDKLRDSEGLPKVQKISGKLSKRWGRGTVLIPAPLEVDEMMRKVPRGKLVTINEIRSALAERHNATIGCPLTTGIFAWIAANAAEEQRRQGNQDITPYWRTLKKGGVLNEKYPGGADAQKRLLEQEGHRVVPKGKRYVVADFEKSIARI